MLQKIHLKFRTCNRHVLTATSDMDPSESNEGVPLHFERHTTAHRVRVGLRLCELSQHSARRKAAT